MTQPVQPVALTAAVLHSEIANDPTTMGYSQYLTSGPSGTPDYQAITNLLNDPSRLSGTGNGLPKFLVPLDVAPLWQSVAWLDGLEFKALAVEDRAYLALLAAAGPNLLLRDPSDFTMQTDSPAFAYIKTLFPEGSRSRVALDRLAVRAGSRAEDLTHVPHTSVAVAQVTAALTAA